MVHNNAVERNCYVYAVYFWPDGLREFCVGYASSKRQARKIVRELRNLCLEHEKHFNAAEDVKVFKYPLNQILEEILTRKFLR